MRITLNPDEPLARTILHHTRDHPISDLVIQLAAHGDDENVDRLILAALHSWSLTRACKHEPTSLVTEWVVVEPSDALRTSCPTVTAVVAQTIAAAKDSWHRRRPGVWGPGAPTLLKACAPIW